MKTDDHKKIIELYSELADKPQSDFGWAKGLENAKAHNYRDEWFVNLPSEIWDYCAAVGNPFSVGKIEEGSVVVDFGCGAGVDLLVSALLVGERGKAIGIDITPKMVQKAKEHAKLVGFKNVEVLECSFETTPIADESVDFVISNGAINLTSCKQSVFAEIYRILKPNGKIYFADMIDISVDDGACCTVGDSSSCEIEQDEWANCVAGTLREEELLNIVKEAGFKDVECDALTHYTTAKTTQGATFRATKIPSDELREGHWDEIYIQKDYTQVLWHQNAPMKSMELINRYAQKYDAIIDAGCGASFLVDNLLHDGYKNITLLDTSKTSLEIVKQRVADGNITYICDDILNFTASEKFDIWHDRAVFHFLTSKKERAKYFEVLLNSLTREGTAIISTFELNGPIACAGLDIVQYDYKKMLAELPRGLSLVESEEYTHITPKESEQAYIYFVIKRS